MSSSKTSTLNWRRSVRSGLLITRTRPSGVVSQTVSSGRDDLLAVEHAVGPDRRPVFARPELVRALDRAAAALLDQAHEHPGALRLHDQGDGLLVVRVEVPVHRVGVHEDQVVLLPVVADGRRGSRSRRPRGCRRRPRSGGRARGWSSAGAARRSAPAGSGSGTPRHRGRCATRCGTARSRRSGPPWRRRRRPSRPAPASAASCACAELGRDRRSREVSPRTKTRPFLPMSFSPSPAMTAEMWLDRLRHMPQRRQRMRCHPELASLDVREGPQGRGSRDEPTAILMVPQGLPRMQRSYQCVGVGFPTAAQPSLARHRTFGARPGARACDWRQMLGPLALDDPVVIRLASSA